MNSNDTREREIYLLIDPQRVRQTSLDVVILLAERLEVAINARLISDELLRQVARLPFTTEIVLSSGEERDLASESIDYLQQQKAYMVRKALEQRAQPRKVKFRVEQSSENISFQVVLEERRDLFLPAMGQSPTRSRGRSRASPLHTVQWVYDNCTASERCFGLLKDLVAAGVTRRVLVYGDKSIPRRLMSELADTGARVCWMSSANSLEMLHKLQSGVDVDLMLLPASFTVELGEAALRELNQRSEAPIMVVG